MFSRWMSIGIWGVLVLVGMAAATTRYVGDGQMYSTIQSAINASEDGDTVIVHPGTYVENLVIEDKSITLRSTDPENASVVANTIIDGNATGSVIRIRDVDEDYLTTSTNTVIRGFTIQNGNAFWDDPETPDYYEPTYQGGDFESNRKNCGGGICVELGNGNNVSVYNCVIKGNYAAIAGGGLYNVDGAIKNCVIEDNSAWCIHTKVVDGKTFITSSKGLGGGLASCIEVNGTAISDCHIENNSSFEGGGLHGCLNIHNSQIIENHTLHDLGNAGHGAGASSCSGIYNCRIQGNYVDMVSDAPGDWAKGGGLYKCDNVINCEIVDNTSQCGGGLYSCGDFTFPVKDCVIACNEATVTDSDSFGGGGAYGGLLVDCIISNNSAYRGGGVFGSAVFTSVISGNHATFGGGFCTIPGTGGMGQSCLISGNEATYGGAVAGTMVNLRNCTIVGNSGYPVVETEGENGEAYLRNCIIWDNLPSDYINADDNDSSNPIEIQYCCFPSDSGNINPPNANNITPSEPGFLRMGNWESNVWVDGDYHLAADSDCIDAGLNSQVDISITNVDEYDLDGNYKIVDFTLNGTNTAIVDIGCYEAIDGPVLTVISEYAATNPPGTLYDGAVYVDGGHTRTALQLDGNGDYLRIDNYKGIEGGNLRICSAWIKTSAPGGQIYMIASWGIAETGKKFMLFLDEYGGTNSRLAVGIWGYRLTGTQKLNDGTWHHVAASYDNTNAVNLLCLYVDGKLEASSNPTIQLNTSNQEDVLIGAYRSNINTITGYFNGLIDDVRIYEFVSYNIPFYQSSKDEITRLAGPRCHWKLDESTGMRAYESTKNTYHGTLHNFEDEACSPAITADKWKKGVLNNALQFDGNNDYVETPSNIINPAQDSFSAFAWVRLDAKGSNYQVILQQIDGGGMGRGWLARLTDDRLQCNLGNSALTTSQAVFATTGQWHHVGVTYNRPTQTLKLYVDGIEAGSKTTTAENCAGALYIGRHKTDTTTYWNGLIDEVRIYDRVLRTDEIQVLADPIIAHWKLDETGGTSASDSSGNLYNGTLYNMADEDWVSGKLNNCLEFDGTDDYVETPANIINPARDSFSAFTWVRLDAKGSNYQVILQQIDGGGMGRGWLARLTDDRLQCNLGNSALTTSQAVFATTGQWHHVGMTYNRPTQTLKLYVDGVESVSTSTTGETCTGALYIGRHKTDTTTYWNGLIDDVRIFTQALTEDDVQIIYREFEN